MKQTKVNFLTTKELKQYVLAAQKGDQEAVNKLCEAFTPLISKEVRRPSVRSSLGEDAEGIAWEVFLKFIYKYSGHEFSVLPGLIRVHIHYELLHNMHQEGCLYDCEAIEEHLETLVDEQQNMDLQDNSILVNDMLGTLSAKQRLVIIELLINNKTLKEIAKEYKMGISTCHTYRERAYKILRKKFHELII